MDALRTRIVEIDEYLDARVHFSRLTAVLQSQRLTYFGHADPVERAFCCWPGGDGDVGHGLLSMCIHRSYSIQFDRALVYSVCVFHSFGSSVRASDSSMIGTSSRIG